MLCTAHTAACNFPSPSSDQMVSPYLLSCLLLLPLGTCFPLLGREKPMDTAVGGIEGEMSRAGGHRGHFPWGSSPWPRAPHPHALLGTAMELQTSGRAHAGFRLRVGRQDDGGEAASFPLADGDKASGPLGTLAEELNGYSRKKGGFSFRFGRRRRRARAPWGGFRPGSSPPPPTHFLSTSLKDPEKTWLFL